MASVVPVWHLPWIHSTEIRALCGCVLGGERGHWGVGKIIESFLWKRLGDLAWREAILIPITWCIPLSSISC